MKSINVFMFVLAATVLEATGDAFVRLALRNPSLVFSLRVGMFLLGAVMLTLYGTSLNLAPVDFATVTGMYVATLFVVFQIVNYVFFRVIPRPGVLVGGALIVAGGLIVFLW